MVKHIIKICGIRDPDMATQTALAGANLIGIVFDPLSPRYVPEGEAFEIAIAAKKAGARPVAVFLNHTYTEMKRICDITQIDIVQLHGSFARDQHHFLPQTYQRIYVQNLSPEGDIEFDAGFKYLDPERDLILIDHSKPGHGIPINRDYFQYHLPFPWLLAGGLTTANVIDALSDLQPNGVDVSSGVESSRGNKDLSLIKNFITCIRGFRRVS